MKGSLIKYRNHPDVEKIARVIARKLGHNDDIGMYWDNYILPAIGVYLEIVEPRRKVSADSIAMFLTDNARIQDGRLENVAYLAVAISDQIEQEHG